MKHNSTKRKTNKKKVESEIKSRVKDNQLFMVEILLAFYQIQLNVNAIENVCFCSVFNTF